MRPFHRGFRAAQSSRSVYNYAPYQNCYQHSSMHYLAPYVHQSPSVPPQKTQPSQRDTTCPVQTHVGYPNLTHTLMPLYSPV